MESYVNCPECGEQVRVILDPYQDAVSGIMKIIENSIGANKTEHFAGKNKCKCGKLVVCTIHVTAEANGKPDKDWWPV